MQVIVSINKKIKSVSASIRYCSVDCNGNTKEKFCPEDKPGCRCWCKFLVKPKCQCFKGRRSGQMSSSIGFIRYMDIFFSVLLYLILTQRKINKCLKFYYCVRCVLHRVSLCNSTFVRFCFLRKLKTLSLEQAHGRRLIFTSFVLAMPSLT